MVDAEHPLTLTRGASHPFAMHLTQLLTLLGVGCGLTAAAGRVKPGIEVLLDSASELTWLQGKTVGIVTNPTGSLPNLVNDVYVLDSQINITGIFSPEQGFNGAQQAGSSSGGYVDPQSGISVYSLYAMTPKEMVASFKNSSIDTVLFDLQDVGARFYTYIWTMADIMEAIAGTDITLVVLDRPNPVNGLDVEGPVLNKNFTSGVGLYPIALRHGMTTGELAYMFNDHFVGHHTGGKKASLKVVWMEGWQRDMYYDDTGLPFIMPSANLPTVDSTIVYPGTGLIEGTSISEGRGTTKPFQILGAPFINWHLANKLTKEDLGGVAFREVTFIPTFDKFANETAVGVELFVTDRDAFNPIRVTIAILIKIKELYGNKFQFIDDDFDILAGTDQVRLDIEAGKTTDEVAAGWQPELHAFVELRSKFLHY